MDHIEESGWWEVDEQGRRYRRTGKGTIEHEPTVFVGGIEIPESQLAEHNRRMRESAERRRKEEEERLKAEANRKNCPFRDTLETRCRGEVCALYRGGGCNLIWMAKNAVPSDSDGKICPFDRYGHKCRADCALLYNGGCVLSAF
jgi:hypothetical protein